VGNEYEVFCPVIHSTTKKPKGDPSNWTPQQVANYYPTSSCKFTTQDVLRSHVLAKAGILANLHSHARSQKTKKPFGLPRARKVPDHVGQNPSCDIGDGNLVRGH